MKSPKRSSLLQKQDGWRIYACTIMLVCICQQKQHWLGHGNIALLFFNSSCRYLSKCIHPPVCGQVFSNTSCPMNGVIILIWFFSRDQPFLFWSSRTLKGLNRHILIKLLVTHVISSIIMRHHITVFITRYLF